MTPPRSLSGLAQSVKRRMISQPPGNFNCLFKQRTAAQSRRLVRHSANRDGGSLGEGGCLHTFAFLPPKYPLILDPFSGK
jgi:hypothetical protein